jgi:hypothetical protein
VDGFDEKPHGFVSWRCFDKNLQVLQSTSRQIRGVSSITMPESQKVKAEIQLHLKGHPWSGIN